MAEDMNSIVTTNLTASSLFDKSKGLQLKYGGCDSIKINTISMIYIKSTKISISASIKTKIGMI